MIPSDVAKDIKHLTNDEIWQVSETIREQVEWFQKRTDEQSDRLLIDQQVLVFEKANTKLYGAAVDLSVALTRAETVEIYRQAVQNRQTFLAMYPSSKLPELSELDVKGGKIPCTEDVQRLLMRIRQCERRVRIWRRQYYHKALRSRRTLFTDRTKKKLAYVRQRADFCLHQLEKTLREAQGVLFCLQKKDRIQRESLRKQEEEARKKKIQQALQYRPRSVQQQTFRALQASSSETPADDL